MGDEVKITVIATGFKDQMPERRARMLSVEEAPVVSVPVMAPDTWLRDPGQVAAAKAAPAAPRFMSEDEDPVVEDEPVFVGAASSSSRKARIAEETETVGVPARPQFAELSEPPAYATRDFASEFASAQAASPVVAEAGEDAERDLDVPAFMRRLQY